MQYLVAHSYFYWFRVDFYRPQRSWGKVMFLQASVILLTGGGASSQGGLLPGGWCLLQEGVYSRGGLVGTPQDGYCCGRYASYWNAFLLVESFYTQGTKYKTAKLDWKCSLFHLPASTPSNLFQFLCKESNFCGLNLPKISCTEFSLTLWICCSNFFLTCVFGHFRLKWTLQGYSL